MRLRILAVAPVLAAGLAVTMPARQASAAPVSCPTLNGATLASQTVSPPDGNAFTLCTGRVPTFDGTPIRVDVSIPTAPYVPAGSSTPSVRRPLMMFLHGYSNDRCQFESSSVAGSAFGACHDYIGNAGYHWNNAYFASQGWVVLNYTSRGWFDSCGKIGAGDTYYPEYPAGYSYLSDSSGCDTTNGRASWVHLYDRRYEIRDAQFLASLLVDAFNNPSSIDVNPSQIVTTGDSGGGGPSWDLALTKDQVVGLGATPSTVATNLTPWVSPLGTPLHLAAALPMYTWTDLVDSLVSNGRSSDGFYGSPPDGNRQAPIGVEKESYVGGLFLLGLSNVPAQPPDGAQYVTAPNSDPTADLTRWFTDINAGEPIFSVNPDTPTILDQIGGPLRSPFAIPVPTGAAEKPVFVIQGMTDPLFPALQPLTMINRLKAVDPSYPVWAFLGDVGHSYSQNPADVWQQAHNLGNAWLNAILAGSPPTQAPITVDTTRCVPGQSLSTFTAASFGQIATQQLTFASAAAQSTGSDATSTEGAQTDPIANSGCRTIASSQSDPGQAIYTFDVQSPVALVGSPYVHVTAAVTGSSAELIARLWDLNPTTGNQTLITRTVYRIDNGTAASATLPLAFELWPNAWQFLPGHKVRLELAQNDAPVWRTDNEPSSISLSNLALTLPVVLDLPPPLPTVMPEVPFAAALPLLAAPIVAGVFALRRRRRHAASA